MSKAKREHRIGGAAGDIGPSRPLADVIKQSIDNANRAGHRIDTAAPKYGDAAPINLYQGEIRKSDLDNAGLRRDQVIEPGPTPAK